MKYVQYLRLLREFAHITRVKGRSFAAHAYEVYCRRVQHLRTEFNDDRLYADAVSKARAEYLLEYARFDAAHVPIEDVS